MGARKKNAKYSLERNYTRVGEFLREARQKAGLKQREVSEALGYSSPQFISNFEAGIAVPPLSKLAIMVQLYKTPVNQLLDIILDNEREVMLRGIKTAPKIHSLSRS